MTVIPSQDYGLSSASTDSPAKSRRWRSVVDIRILVPSSQCAIRIFHHTEITKYFEIRQSYPLSSSITSSTSFLMFGTFTYGTLSRIHRPSNQSTLQSPEPVVDASSGAPPRPLPVFHVTRWTPTSGGHTPVLMLASDSSFFLACFTFRVVDLS